jgi:hypothetical protein
VNLAVHRSYCQGHPKILHLPKTYRLPPGGQGEKHREQQNQPSPIAVLVSSAPFVVRSEASELG